MAESFPAPCTKKNREIACLCSGWPCSRASSRSNPSRPWSCYEWVVQWPAADSSERAISCQRSSPRGVELPNPSAACSKQHSLSINIPAASYPLAEHTQQKSQRSGELFFSMPNSTPLLDNNQAAITPYRKVIHFEILLVLAPNRTMPLACRERRMVAWTMPPTTIPIRRMALIRRFQCPPPFPWGRI